MPHNPGAHAPSPSEHNMANQDQKAPNTEALDKLCTLVVDAYNDTSNAFGQGKKSLSIAG